MSQIDVNNLTFYYEGSFDNIFENVSFSVDTDWKLGLIGRNGKGKTTFLNLLLGKYEYNGNIRASTHFDYFPYLIPESHMQKKAADFLEELKPGCEFWRVLCELNDLELDAEVLCRPFGTLSHGERTKVMLAVLFSGENDFLLIDEPTNHLDQASRETVKAYLGSKKGFILVSHDRDLLDACIDHVLVLNRQTIEVQSGNFSSWWENKERKDAFARMENEKHLKEIGKLKKAASRAKNWADNNEKTKIGFDPRKEPDRNIATRAYIGAKTKKMQSRVKQMEHRLEREIREKEGLLNDVEQTVELRLTPLSHHKERLLTAEGYGLGYDGRTEPVFQDLTFSVERGERVFLSGKNGCGKTSLLKAVLAAVSGEREQGMKAAGLWERGTLRTASGIIVSYVNQDTSFLKGAIREYCRVCGLDESLFCAVLRQLGMERVQFVKPMEDYSEGQKKKVLIAASLLTPAHLYIWDEPLNYMDLFSRMQIEELLLAFRPTLLAVEHDVRFQEKVATKIVHM
ncbi:MAG TPA: Lsa family ABC-F type ribosomal protection protein [Lachnospiraceae bacterium]|nr:Lsa family ABC-F type ribosomal protection protein [Lachnospiraceae bacterium]